MTSIGPGNCADCGNPYPHLQRAHIIARHKGGTDDPSNIIHICPNCHHLRDRADRVAWVKKRWENTPPEQRASVMRAQMAALPIEAQLTRGQKISASKTGKKNKPSTKPRGPEVWSPRVHREAHSRSARSLGGKDSRGALCACC